MARERSKNREESQSQSVQRQGAGQVSRRETWPSYTPFGMMRRFADEMDRVFEDFGFPALGRSWGSSWGSSGMERFSPQVDIFERDSKLVVRADLPGMTKDDVKVDVTEDAVVIEGERKYEHEEDDKGVYRSERSYGHFYREIPLPEGVKTENATANFKNGVLEVTLDASQTAKNRRRIEIQGEERGSKPGQGGQTAA
jgi:HSP20 family protein